MTIKKNHSEAYFKRLSMLVDAVDTTDRSNISLDLSKIPDEFFTSVDGIISKTVTLGELDAAIDLFRRPEYHPLYDMFNRMYLILIGTSFKVNNNVPNIKSFNIEKIGDILKISIVTSDDAELEETVEFVGSADKIWTARILSGLHTSVNIVPKWNDNYRFKLEDRVVTFTDI